MPIQTDRTTRPRVPRRVHRWLEEWTTSERDSRPRWRQFTPPRLFVGSFAVLVLLGTLGLLVLPGLYTGPRLGPLDALFTATSAVCVTGLIVVDTATAFTPFGQAFVLLLIQLGGLGIITFTTLIIVALGRRVSLHHEALVGGDLRVAPHVRFEDLTRHVVHFTFLVEGVGAVLLYIAWAPGMGWDGAIWPAVFHSVSAFCNAGFSTSTTSLVGFSDSPAPLWIIMALIVAGGLGFLTIEELTLAWRERRARRRSHALSLHSRLALSVTGALILGGAVVFGVLEWENTLTGKAPVDKATNAMFMSVTARTAGFNSIDYAAASDGTNFFTVLLMFVGGSPGSTAGGLKTTTLAILLVLAWSRLRGKRVPSIFGRSIPEETINRTIGLTVLAAAVFTVAVLILSATEAAGPEERNRFLAVVFEAASALNTVGLSTGLTPDLSATGRFVGVALMFLGRVGPLTVAAALASSIWREPRGFRYAYEDVIVG